MLVCIIDEASRLAIDETAGLVNDASSRTDFESTALGNALLEANTAARAAIARYGRRMVCGGDVGTG